MQADGQGRTRSVGEGPQVSGLGPPRSPERPYQLNVALDMYHVHIRERASRTSQALTVLRSSSVQHHFSLPDTDPGAGPRLGRKHSAVARDPVLARPELKVPYG